MYVLNLEEEALVILCGRQCIHCIRLVCFSVVREERKKALGNQSRRRPVRGLPLFTAVPRRIPLMPLLALWCIGFVTFDGERGFAATSLFDDSDEDDINDDGLCAFMNTPVVMKGEISDVDEKPGNADLLFGIENAVAMFSLP